MTTLLLRYHVAEKDVQTVVHAIETAFAGLEKAHPAGLRFAYYRVADAAELVGLVELDDGVENPLPTIEATRQLKAVVDRLAIGSPPLPSPLKRIAKYEG